MAKKCNLCGNTMEDEDLFCDSCGAAYENNTENVDIAELEVHIKQAKEGEVGALLEQAKKIKDREERRRLLQLCIDVSKEIVEAQKRNNYLILEEKVQTCTSVDEAIKLVEQIEKAKFSHRETYWLKRNLKKSLEEINDEVIKLSKGLTPMHVMDIVKYFLLKLFELGICKVILSIDVDLFKVFRLGWLPVIGKIGLYIIIVQMILILIMCLIMIIRWGLLSKDGKEATYLLEKLKDNNLFFDKREYIIPDSDMRYIEPEEVPKNEFRRQLAYLEIYARHGSKYIPNRDVKRHFTSKSWYKKDAGRPVKDNDLNKYEVSNYNLLRGNVNGKGIKYVE